LDLELVPASSDVLAGDHDVQHPFINVGMQSKILRVEVQLYPELRQICCTPLTWDGYHLYQTRPERHQIKRSDFSQTDDVSVPETVCAVHGKPSRPPMQRSLGPDSVSWPIIAAIFLDELQEARAMTRYTDDRFAR